MRFSKASWKTSTVLDNAIFQIDSRRFFSTPTNGAWHCSCAEGRSIAFSVECSQLAVGFRVLSSANSARDPMRRVYGDFTPHTTRVLPRLRRAAWQKMNPDAIVSEIRGFTFLSTHTLRQTLDAFCAWPCVAYVFGVTSACE